MPRIKKKDALSFLDELKQEIEQKKTISEEDIATVADCLQQYFGEESPLTKKALRVKSAHYVFGGSEINTGASAQLVTLINSARKYIEKHDIPENEYFWPLLIKNSDFWITSRYIVMTIVACVTGAIVIIKSCSSNTTSKSQERDEKELTIPETIKPVIDSVPDSLHLSK